MMHAKEHGSIMLLAGGMMLLIVHWRSGDSNDFCQENKSTISLRQSPVVAFQKQEAWMNQHNGL